MEMWKKINLANCLRTKLYSLNVSTPNHFCTINCKLARILTYIIIAKQKIRKWLYKLRFESQQVVGLPRQKWVWRNANYWRGHTLYRALCLQSGPVPAMGFPTQAWGILMWIRIRAVFYKLFTFKYILYSYIQCSSTCRGWVDDVTEIGL